VQAIPLRHRALVSALAGVMVAETIENSVPYGFKALNEHRLCEGYPYIIHDKKTAIEISDIKILCCF
jgi:hypothetical protein